MKYKRTNTYFHFVPVFMYRRDVCESICSTVDCRQSANAFYIIKDIILCGCMCVRVYHMCQLGHGGLTDTDLRFRSSLHLSTKSYRNLQLTKHTRRKKKTEPIFRKADIHYIYVYNNIVLTCVVNNWNTVSYHRNVFRMDCTCVVQTHKRIRVYVVELLFPLENRSSI